MNTIVPGWMKENYIKKSTAEGYIKELRRLRRISKGKCKFLDQFTRKHCEKYVKRILKDLAPGTARVYMFNLQGLYGNLIKRNLFNGANPVIYDRKLTPECKQKTSPA